MKIIEFSKDITIALLTAMTLLSCGSAIASYMQVHSMMGVVKRLAAEREVTHEKSRINHRSRDYKAGYHAAMMDKRNIKVFGRWWESRRTPIIEDYFEGR